METLSRIVITAFLVLLLQQFLSGIHVDSFYTSIIVAIVLSLLNLFVKPILILFTLPITIVTLGLFLLIVNAIIIQLCDWMVDGFNVQSLWSAIIFSILLSISQSIVYSFIGINKKKH